jgi:hypothetical protein
VRRRWRGCGDAKAVADQGDGQGQGDVTYVVDRAAEAGL